MKTLENYGVLEMNTAEMKEIDGGVIGLLIAAFIMGLMVGGTIALLVK